MVRDVTSATSTSDRERSGSTVHADEGEGVVVPEVTPATATSVFGGSGCVVPGSGSVGCNCFVVMSLCFMQFKSALFPTLFFHQLC